MIWFFLKHRRVSLLYVTNLKPLTGVHYLFTGWLEELNLKFLWVQVLFVEHFG